MAEPTRPASPFVSKFSRTLEGARKLSGREAVLGRVRKALGRTSGQLPRDVPPVRLRRAGVDKDLVLQFCATADDLGVKAFAAHSTGEAREYVARLIDGKQAIASNAPFLAECGITSLDGVKSNVFDKPELRELCARADAGITSADYALADTGTLVMLSSTDEARMISLLPPVHIAVVNRERIWPGLDDLLHTVPLPAEVTSCMVLITGTSRTADIEQILVRGVHGPGEVHIIVV